MSEAWLLFIAFIGLIVLYVTRRIHGSKPVTLQELRHLVSTEELTVEQKNEITFHLDGATIRAEYTTHSFKKEDGMTYPTINIKIVGKRGRFMANFMNDSALAWKAPKEKMPTGPYCGNESERWLVESILITIQCAITASLNKDQSTHVA